MEKEINQTLTDNKPQNSRAVVLTDLCQFVVHMDYVLGSQVWILCGAQVHGWEMTSWEQNI